MSASGTPLKLVVMISGSGTTLKNLLASIKQGELQAQAVKVIASNPQAGGLKYAVEAEIATAVVERKNFNSVEAFSEALFAECRQVGADAVAMGGWLKLVVIPQDFMNRVLNIHPSLIPAFCGQGYYGRKVHQAVIDYGAKVSGCTVHFVDNQYDHGPIILQQAVPVLDHDTPETLAARVFEQECVLYRSALRLFAAGRLRMEGRQVKVDHE